MLGGDRRIDRAGFIAGLVDGVVVGVAGEQLESGQHFTADLGVNALADHLTLVQVAAVVRPEHHRVARVLDGGVLLLDTVDRDAGVDLVVQDQPLEADLIVLRRGGVQRLVRVRLLQELWLVGFGVAEVGGPLWRQVESQPGIRRGYALFLEPTMVRGRVVQNVAQVIEEHFHVTVFVGGNPGAEYELGPVAQRQAGHAVVTVFLGRVVIGLVRQAAQVGRAFEVEDVDRDEVVVAPALHGIAFGVRVVGAQQHVVTQLEEVEATFDVAVDALALQPGLGGVVQPYRALQGDRVDRAIGEQGVGVAIHVHVGQVGGPGPVFVEGVVELEVGLFGLLVHGVPGGDVGGLA
ncbi:hypothetical protein D3C77_243330 [compost metagenome]